MWNGYPRPPQWCPWKMGSRAIRQHLPLEGCVAQTARQHTVCSPVNPENVRKPNLSRILLYFVFLFHAQYNFVVFNFVTPVLPMWWLWRTLKISSMTWKPNNIQRPLSRVKYYIQVWERQRYKPPRCMLSILNFQIGPLIISSGNSLMSPSSPRHAVCSHPRAGSRGAPFWPRGKPPSELRQMNFLTWMTTSPVITFKVMYQTTHLDDTNLDHTSSRVLGSESDRPSL